MMIDIILLWIIAGLAGYLLVAAGAKLILLMASKCAAVETELGGRKALLQMAETANTFKPLVFPKALFVGPLIFLLGIVFLLCALYAAIELSREP